MELRGQAWVPSRHHEEGNNHEVTAQVRCLAVGESVTKCPSPFNVLKYTYDNSCC